MGQVSIQKVKLIKGERLAVSYEVTHADKSHSSLSEERDTLAHSDLKAAIQSLALHLAVITDQVTVRTSKAEGALDPFIVTGYSRAGADEGEGVTITGYKLLPNGQAFNFNAPFTRLDPGDSGGYYFLTKLVADLELADTEVLAYLDGSKKAPDPQLQLFPEEGSTNQSQSDADDTDEIEDEPKRPAKKRGRPKKDS